jgi:hypothetical protein
VRDAAVRSRRMDLRRLRVGEWIVGASGLVLLVSLFLKWYGIGQGAAVGPVADLDAYASAWDSFTILDVLLALGALAAIAVVIVTSLHSTPALPLAMQSLLTLVGFILLVLVVFRLIDPPDVQFVEGGGGRQDVTELTRGVGAWLGLIGTLGITAGSLVAIRDERLSPAGRHTDLSGVPVAGPREIEKLPAPRPGAGA